MPRLNSNLDALRNAYTLKKNERSLSKSLERLSTGVKINRASDDAAGLSVSEQLRVQARGLKVGNRNIQDGISVVNIAEGGLTEIGNMIQRMRELSLQTASETITNEDRGYVQAEMDQLIEEIDRISESTSFNGMNLINGSAPWGTVGGTIHAGPNTGTEDLLNIKINSATATSLGVDAIDVTTQAGAVAAIGLFDTAIESLNLARGKIGATVNRLDHALTNQMNIESNVVAAESVVRDTDMAYEIAAKARLDILGQASISMLAQANSNPDKILGLLNNL